MHPLLPEDPGARSLPVGFPYLDAVLAAICAAILVIALMLAPSAERYESGLPKGTTTTGSVETASR